MPKIDLTLDAIEWPAECCCCGSGDFGYHTHTEDVVIRSIVSVTEYQRVTLERVPMCQRCRSKRFLWYSGAVLMVALAAFLPKIGLGEHASQVFLVCSVIGVALAVVGTRSNALRILKLDQRDGSATMEIYNSNMAAVLLQRETLLRATPAYRARHAQVEAAAPRKAPVAWRIVYGAIVFGGLLATLIGGAVGLAIVAFGALIGAYIETKR